MMNDIVEWLRDRAFRKSGPTMKAAHTKQQEWIWADEIIRLRAENEKLREEVMNRLREENDNPQEEVMSDYNEGWEEGLAAMKAENERIKAAFRVNMLRAFPNMSHEEIDAEINRVLETNDEN